MCLLYVIDKETVKAYSFRVYIPILVIVTPFCFGRYFCDLVGQVYQLQQTPTLSSFHLFAKAEFVE